MQTQELGGLAADFMDDLARDYGEDAEIGVSAVVCEIHFTDSEGEPSTALQWRSTDDRIWAQVGLFRYVAEAILSSGVEPDNDG